MVDTASTCTPWATSADACAPCNDYNFDTVELDKWCQVASDVLFNLTGRRWAGLCSDLIRPQARYRAAPRPRWWSGSDLGSTTLGGSRSLWGWCSCNRGRETGCSTVPEIKLPGFPVVPASIEVTIDGDTFEDFRLDDGRYLVRTDGHGWPCCQRLILPTTERGTWSVAYQFGLDPPVGGVMMAAELGCQYALARDPAAVADGRCRLPKRTISMVRQGTAITLLDPQKYIKDGQVGLPEVDTWVMSVMMGDRRRRSTVLVPGRGRTARRTS